MPIPAADPVQPLTHSISTLRYRLLAGVPDLAPLRVLDCRELMWYGWNVRFLVLGASHAVCLAGPHATVTELLTCGNAGGEAHLLAESVCETWNSFAVETSGLRCRVRLQPFDLREGDALLDFYAPDSTLSLAFPPQSESGISPSPPPPFSPSIFPVTRLGWRVERSGLHIETVHTYPEEGRGVRSRTVFSRWSPAA